MVNIRSLSRRHVLSGAAAGLLSARRAAASPSESRKFTVLTVAGAIETANRPPFSAGRDKFFAAQNTKFDKAFAFSREELLALPQSTLSADTTFGRASLSGPKISDVLKAAGVSGAAQSARVVGLDGYSAEISLADIASQGWVLGLSANGSPLGLGDLGPTYVVRELSAGVAKSEAEDAKWVHSTFFIEVKA